MEGHATVTVDESGATGAVFIQLADVGVHIIEALRREEKPSLG